MSRPLIRFAVAALASAFAATGAAAAPSPGHVAINDDPLELEAVLSTEPGFRSTRGLVKYRWNDNHLRAVVDKKSGAVRFEVRQTLQYTGVFRQFERVHYETTGTPAASKLTRLADNRGACDIFDAPSTCIEEVAFAVPEPLLRDMAVAPKAQPWAMKFKSVSGRDLKFQISRVEIAALLAAVDRYRAAPTSSDDARSASLLRPKPFEDLT